jgi:hypothetical protein
MPGTPNFIHGRLGTVSIGGSLFNSLQFDFESNITLDDITYSQAGGATGKVLLPGIYWAIGTITFVYDTNNQPVLAPFTFQPTGNLMALILYPDGTKPFAFSAYSGQLKWGSGPKAGPTNCSTRFESTGNISYPAS